jgi:hypothetical protein
VAADELLEALRVVARALVPEIASALRGGGAGSDAGGPYSQWVDQHESDLTPREHCKAARRRIAEGKGGVKRAPGRRYLMTREAVWEEMCSIPKPGLRKCGAQPETRNAEPATATPSRRDSIREATAERLRQLRSKRK